MCSSVPNVPSYLSVSSVHGSTDCRTSPLVHPGGWLLMSSSQRPCITHAEAAPYRSSACRIGTHHTCAESSPATAPIDVPVVYEACDCPCHATTNQPAPVEVLR